MGPILGRVWRSCQWHPCSEARNISPGARPQVWASLALRVRLDSKQRALLAGDTLIPGCQTQSMTSGCRNMPKHVNKRQTGQIYYIRRCDLVGQALSLFSLSRYHYCVCVIDMMYHYLLVCQISWIYTANMQRSSLAFSRKKKVLPICHGFCVIPSCYNLIVLNRSKLSMAPCQQCFNLILGCVYADDVLIQVWAYFGW
jgi:hypothetical protein